MCTDAFKSFTEQAEKTMNPLIKFNKLMARNVEQLTELQLNAVRSYSELGVNQLKTAAEVKDLTSLTAFNSDQVAAMAKVFEQVSEDSKKLQDLAREFKDELNTLASENTEKKKPE